MGRRSVPAWSARRGRRSGLTETETDDRETSAARLAAGVPAAIDGGPQPAGPRRAGVGRRRQPAPLAGPTRRNCCWPSWAGPAGSTRSSRPACAPRARRSSPGRRRRLPVPVRRRAACSTRPGSACCCRRGGTGAASWGSRCRRHTPVDGVVEQGRQVRPRPARRLPLGARRRRRHAHRGRDRRARRDQGPADPAARPVGGGGSRSAAPRAGVPGAQADRPETAAEILALAASHPDDIDTPLEVTAVRADGWLGDLLGGAAAHSRCGRWTPPAGFTATLRPYQQRGLSWLAFLSSLGLGSCLADDMGLGKTVQLLALESAQRHEEPDTGADAAAVPDVVGRQLAAGGREIRTGTAGVRPPRQRAAARRRAGRAPRATPTCRHHLCHRHPRHRRAGRLPVEPGGAGRGAGREEQPVPRRQGGAPAGGRAPGGADRHPGGEPARRTVVHHGLSQPGPARLVRGVPHPIRDPGREVRPDRAGRAAAHGSPGPTFCAGSRPTRRSSTTCPRRSRSSSTAGSPPNRPRCIRPSSTR